MAHSLQPAGSRLRGISVDETEAFAFAARYGHLFEHSPWVVERTWQRRPFADRQALHDTLLATVAEASPAEQLALVRAHPELAGRLAPGLLTHSSQAEQSGAGLRDLNHEELQLFQQLNKDYRDRFGFPFVICVRLTDKAGILAAMQRRLQSDPALELREALRQIGYISALRLADIDAPPATPEPPTKLAQLAQMIERDLEALGVPASSWLTPHTAAGNKEIKDVVIVGGGQSGLGAAFGLFREGVQNIVVLDENPAGLEGPWISYARMLTLRTPKHLTGIDLGVPSLTYRAWHEARYGRAHWDALGKIARSDWMEYLGWYRQVLKLPVVNQVRVTAIKPAGPGRFTLELTGPGATASTLLTRKVVLATGIQGGGEWHVPDRIRTSLPADRYSHSSQPIDFGPLKGKRIGILGGGASAFDNAHHALTHGVAEAHVFVRRPALQRVNPIRHMEKSGISRYFGLLDDARRYAATAHFMNHSQPPTNDTFNRASALAGFRLHLGAPWQRVAATATGVAIDTGTETFEFDYLIISTGLRNDLALRPELNALADDILLWKDHYSAPEPVRNAAVDDHPYLGANFEYLGRTPAGATRLHGLFAFNYSALASIGLSAASLSGLAVAIPKLVSGIAGQLFLDDQEQILDDFFSYSEPEFLG